MSSKSIVCFLIFTSLQLVPFISAAESRKVTIGAAADNTLYENAKGSVSNGAGPLFLAGRINHAINSIRRAVLYFDVAGKLPPDVIVEEVSLTLFLEKGNGGMRELRLYHLNSAWGEGASSVNGGGQGAQARPGDTTWLHTFHPDAFWDREGGQYHGEASAMLAVGNPGTGINRPGPYTWKNNRHMVDDVRRWLQQPDSNHGWILVGDESAPQTVKRFSSRESTIPSQRPVLEVTYSLPEKDE